MTVAAADADAETAAVSDAAVAFGIAAASGAVSAVVART